MNELFLQGCFWCERPWDCSSGNHHGVGGMSRHQGDSWCSSLPDIVFSLAESTMLCVLVVQKINISQAHLTFECFQYCIHNLYDFHNVSGSVVIRSCDC